MGNVNTGLNLGGRTAYFNITYDDALASNRGKELAENLMLYCDDDFRWLQGFFPGTMVGTPIYVNFANTLDVADAGAEWSGWGLIPLSVTLKIGMFPVLGADPVTVARYLLVVEASEMLMREMQTNWFEASDEGSKGESLSLLIGVQFLRDRCPGVTMLPTIGGGTFSVSQLWLNGTRSNSIDNNQDDIQHDEVTGCGTAFLFFLHDQLGFSINQIINAGGSTLSHVYQNLTMDASTNAFSTFLNLVNLHYPISAGGYSPLMETIFPVPTLMNLVGPSELSWISNGPSEKMLVLFDKIATVDTTVMVRSDDQSIIEIDSTSSIKTVPPIIQVLTGRDFVDVLLNVLPQGTTFKEKIVNIIVDYAGVELTHAIHIVRPEDLKLPPLQISVKPGDDPCMDMFVEGSALTLVINNLNVFYQRNMMTFKWSVTGATIAKDNQAEIFISSLPAAGTKVIVDVVATNSQRLHANGHFEFSVKGKMSNLEELEHSVQCKIKNIKLANKFIPPWIPVETKHIKEEHLTLIEKQLRLFMNQVGQIITSIEDLKRARNNANKK